MRVYVDVVLIINFFLDYLLLLCVSLLLKRRVKMIRIIMGAFVGSLSILLLFININSFELFALKVLISILMILISFGYKSIKYTLSNFIYLYIVSIVLGGGLYFINNLFSYDKKGIIFINNGYSLNIIILFIMGPIIIFFYNRQARLLRNNYNNYYNVVVYYQNKVLNTVGYLDTGNTLKFNRSMVLLLDKRKNIFKIKNYLLIPYNTIDKNGLLKAFKPDKVIINNKCIDCLIGLIDRVDIDGCGMILNERIEI